MRSALVLMLVLLAAVPASAAAQEVGAAAMGLGQSPLYVDPSLRSALTDQERILLGHIAEGLTNRQIAEQMFLAEKTVKNYVSSILSKLGLERRTQAAVLASKLLGPSSGHRGT